VEESLTSQVSENRKNYLFDYSTISLIISNLVVIVLAIIQNWELGTVLWVYWSQSVIIGVFNFFRIVYLKNFSTENFTIADRPVQPTEGTKLFTAFFFAFHYGFFHFVYAGFLGVDFLFRHSEISLMSVLFGGGIFAINHFFSFQHNRANDERIKQNIGKLMFSPYFRIIPMHIFLVLGGISGGVGLVFFLILKGVADVIGHVSKHRIGLTPINP
jgi:hypothetical protein